MYCRCCSDLFVVTYYMIHFFYYRGLFLKLQIVIKYVHSAVSAVTRRLPKLFSRVYRHRQYEGKCFICSSIVLSMLCKETVKGWPRIKISISLVCLVCLTLKSEGKKARGARGLFRVAWAAVDREARSSCYHSNPCIAHTGVSLCLELICAILILLKKELPGRGFYVDNYNLKGTWFFPTIEWI